MSAITTTTPLESARVGTPSAQTNLDVWVAKWAKEWTGMIAAFDHTEHGRAYGRCTACAYVGRDDTHGIPDFDVSIESLRTGKALTVRLVAARCQFYTSVEAAKDDALLRLQQTGEGQG